MTTPLDELIARLRSSAKAFRENSVYDSEGDEIRLIVQADECDEAADTLVRLRDAMEPFARVANHCLYEPDETILYVHQCIMSDLPLTIGDFRRARLALTTTKIEKDAQ